MGSKGDSSREEGESSKATSRRRPSGLIIALAVVVMLLLTVMYTAWVKLPGPEGPEPETVEDGVTIIRGDVVWEGRTGILDTRVEVRRGGSLRLVDCDLRVLLEDLAASREDWFSVEGELTIESSRVEIWKDPRLDRALAFEGRLRYSPMEPVPPYIFRAINLKGATEPVLSFETRVFGDGGEMIVAYQEAPGEDLQVLTLLELQLDPVEVWQHHEVSLAPLSGSIVNLFIIGHDPGLGRYLLGNLRVTDGDGDLPRDIHFSGFPDRDRWGYIQADEVLGNLRRDPWGDLIRCTGSLTVRDSNLTCPRDIDHTYSSTIHADIKFNEYDPGEAPVLYHKMKDGGDIDAADAEVVIERSGLEHVLLRAHDCELTIRDVQFTGDREIMTAYRCSGTVEGTTFLGQHDRSDTTEHWYGHGGPRFWGLAVWYQRDEGSMKITDCTFQDTPLGLDLTHAVASVDGCTFVNCSFMGIWDHNSTGLEDWEALNGTCDFSKARGMWYYRSHNGRATLTSPTTPEDWQDMSSDWNTDGYIEGVDAGRTCYCEDFWVFRAWARMYVPTFSVNNRGVAEPISEVYVRLVSNWGGGTLATLDTSLSQFVIELPGNGTASPPPTPTRTYLRIEEEQLNGTGVLDILVEASFWFDQQHIDFAAPDGLVLHLFRDDELARVFPLEEGHQGGIFDYKLNTSVSIHPGANRVEFVLEGVPWGSEEVEELARFNRTYLRQSGSEDLVGLLAQYSDEYPTTLIDAGIQVEIDCADIAVYNKWEDSYGVYLQLFTEEGSTVTLTDIADLDLCDLWLIHEGPGDVRLCDIDTEGSYLNTLDTSLVVENSTLGSIEGPMSFSDIRFVNVTLGSDIWWRATACNITIEDSHILADWCYLSMTFSAFTLNNTSVTGEGNRRFYLYPDINDSIILRNCTFDGVSLNLGGTDYSHRLIEVRDCEFWNGSVLEAPIHSSRWSVNEPLPEDPGFRVTNTTITGEGSCFIGHTTMYEAAREGLRATDGASLRVYVDTRIKMQHQEGDGDWHYAEFIPIGVGDLVEWEHNGNDGYIVFRSLHILDEDGHLGDAVHLDVGISGDEITYSVEPMVWFDTIDLMAPNITITVPLWGSSFDLVRDLLEFLGVYAWWGEA